MRKKFIAKKKKKRNFKIRFLIFLVFLFFFLSISVTYNFFLKGKCIVDNKMFVNIIMNNSSFYKNNNSFLIDKVSDLFVPYKIVLLNYRNGFSESKENGKKVISTISKKTDDIYKPYIYIYNSHQSEEYVTSEYLEYTIKPTVTVNNYIMEDVFKKNGYSVLVEEGSISNILSSNGWRYNYSYDASRILMENARNKYPSLSVFIDVHRDSLNKDKTSITINNKKFAKIIFLIGLENPTYQENLNFTEKINNIINNNYPGLSKGIYKKGGKGVNGVYNQDFSSRTILVEIGGVDNTISEVMNSSIAVADAISEVIKESEG